ncbi:carboxypeptidase-like regulatory domain-containing protein [Muricauda brasiliensis]|uniref:carboxypeptidase-like regulatory domain-containing protein n=1 Tax=Muricauda brasiliensis TaxID=2162892 RepID=UPI000D37603B|nr:carboxypeptidase-like regulatory domain-containing protein [Muricauda brasiliensis]
MILSKSTHTFRFSFFFILFYFPGFGQMVQLSGVVQDSTGSVLPNANIIAFPEDTDSKTSFAISGEDGEYILFLRRNSTYTIDVSYIGYKEESLKLKLSGNQKKNFLLIPKVNQLEEVELTYRIPVVVKRDTTIYNVEAFATGEERKIRELLKKLPGIEVDIDGNVTAQGERITKVLVDGDVFFTGDSKMAVNNIPASVVDQIEILDNYNQIAFLKGLQDTDDKALNIKLKDDNKRFAFGDLEAGVGLEDRYVIHPALFYYSPKTNINLIGDFNNISQSSFTYDDYVNFEGGYSNLIFDSSNKFDSQINSDISNFLDNTNFNSKRNRFGALHVKQYISRSTDISSYVIASSNNSTQLRKTVNQYLDSESPFVENRTENENLDNLFSLGKLTIDYKASQRESLQFNTYFKISDNLRIGELNSITASDIDLFNTTNQLKTFLIEPNLNFNKKFSLAQTLSFNLDWTYEKFDGINTWSNDDFFLENILPLQESDNILVNQLKEGSKSNLEISLKDFWGLNSNNHIYTTLGYNKRDEIFESSERQILDDETSVDFSSDGFGNSINYQYKDLLLGLEYKFLWEKFTTKIGLFFHKYNWSNTQDNIYVFNELNRFLPEFRSEYRINSGESLSFQYKQELGFPTANQLVGNFIINDFNRVFLGNPNLRNQLAQTYVLTYRKFNLIKGLSINAIINYSNQNQSIKNSTTLSGIEQKSSPFIFDQPENSITALFSFSKRKNDLKYTLRTNASYNEFFQVVNSNTNLNISKSVSSLFKVESYFRRIPNFELSYNYSPTFYRTSASTFEFTQNTFLANLNYRIEGVKSKFEYSKIFFSNQANNTQSDFDVAKVSISYQAEDSPWFFETEASNFFNTQFRRQSSITDFLISDERNFIIPRVLLFKVAYKL